MLTQIHQEFYEKVDAMKDDDGFPDVKVILPNIKRAVFEGCAFVFSGVFSQKSNPQNQHLWRISEDFGATCQLSIDDSTTHLITCRDDTEKVLEASEPGSCIEIVGPEWVYDSIRNWKKLDCEDYRVKAKLTGSVRRKRRIQQVEEEIPELQDEDLDLKLLRMERAESPILLQFDEDDLDEINKELEELDEDDDEGEIALNKSSLAASQVTSDPQSDVTDDSLLAELEESLLEED